MFLSKKIFSVTLTSLLIFQSITTSLKTFAVGDYPDTQVFSEKEDLLQSWGSSTGGKKAGSEQKILFGKQSKTGSLIPWWIASRVLLNGTPSSTPGVSSHMIIYSVHGLYSEAFNDKDPGQIEYSSLDSRLGEEFKYLQEKNLNVFPNHYGVSGVRKCLQTFLSGTDRFSKGEKKLIKESLVKTFDANNNVEYETKESFYLPSGNKSFRLMSWDTKDISTAKKSGDVNPESIIPFDFLASKTDNDDRVMWLRSAEKEKPNCSMVAMPFGEPKVTSQRVNYEFEVLPVCKISVEDLMFASAASSSISKSPCTLNGKFEAINKADPGYGMQLKYRAAGTELVDASVEIDPRDKSIVHYYNAPKDSFITVCATEKGDLTKSYFTSMNINKTDEFQNGIVDLKKLNDQIIGINKELQIKVWLERKEDSGLAVVTPAASTEFITDSHKFSIAGGVVSKVYDGKEKVLSDLVVKFDDKVLKNGTDYNVSYFSNKDIGTAVVLVNGKGEYDGYVDSATFEIEKAVPQIILKDKTVAFNGEYQSIDPASIIGINGEPITKAKIKYVYYSDEKCTKKIYTYDPSVKKDKTSTKAPKDLGVYFVKAVFGENDEYCCAESNVAKLTVKEFV